MSHYDEVLKEAREKAAGSAGVYIPRLFKILVDEDKHTPEEARAIIEHDLISYWARTTIRKNLPDEAKDEIKAKAGKEGAKATNLVLAGGQTQQITENVTTPADDKLPADREPAVRATAPEEIKQLVEEEEEDPNDLEIAFLKEKVSELEDALKKTQQFQPATALESQPSVSIDAILYQDEILKLLQKQADGVHSFFYDAYGIDLFKNRELAQLKNSGVKVFRRLYFEV